IEDPAWLLRPPVGQGLRTVEAFGLAFDALVRPAHLRNLRRLLASHPGLRVVVDHGAKPEIAAGRFGRWAADIRGLAEETRAWVKLSGLVTEAGPDWSVERLRPYVEHLLEYFGPQRDIFGSDWPVVTLRAGYPDRLRAADTLLGGLQRRARARLNGLTPVEA